MKATPVIARMKTPPMPTARFSSRLLFTVMNRTTSCGWASTPMPTPMTMVETTIHQRLYCGVAEAELRHRRPALVADGRSRLGGREIRQVRQRLVAVDDAADLGVGVAPAARSCPTNMITPWRASVYITPLRPPKNT